MIHYIYLFQHANVFFKFTVDRAAFVRYNDTVIKKERKRTLTSGHSLGGQYSPADGSAVFCCECAGALQPHYFSLEVLIIGKLDHQINEEIRDKEVRVIDNNGQQLGLMSAQAALNIAIEQDMDLVKIAPGANPPVCKIMDYGKFRFEQAKKEKEARKNQHVVEIKEIRMSPGIDTNDFNVKVRNAQKFLGDGDRVKVTVRFRGREMAHTNIGEELLVKFGQQCSEIATVEKNPKLDGRHMTMFLSPKTGKSN